jgi:hypothetical protein
VIACAMGALAFSAKGTAQNDAAEKAHEGDIGHWIEYYKARQATPDAQPAQAPVDAPVEREKSGESARESAQENARRK